MAICKCPIPRRMASGKSNWAFRLWGRCVNVCEFSSLWPLKCHTQSLGLVAGSLSLYVPISTRRLNLICSYRSSDCPRNTTPAPPTPYLGHHHTLSPWPHWRSTAWVCEYTFVCVQCWLTSNNRTIRYVTCTVATYLKLTPSSQTHTQRWRA